MQIFFFALGFLGLTVQLKAQHIIAGQHTATDYHVDITDTTLHYNPYSIPTRSIDINGDGILDFDISIWFSQSSGSKKNYVALTARDSNQIAFSNFDSCSNAGQPYLGPHPIAESFNVNDSINANCGWQGYTMQYLIYSSYSGIQVSYTSCYAVTFSSTPTFLGVRIFLSGDTLYGWVKVSIVGWSDCTIYEYACNALNAGISTANPEIKLSLFPNPASSFFDIEIRSNTSREVVQMEILNQLGQAVYLTQIVPNVQNRKDVNFLSSGVYAVQLFDGSSIIRRKFIKLQGN